MSELCKLYCTNYVECHTRLDQAVAEGTTLDVQEKAWADSASRLPERQTDLVLQLAAHEFEQSLGGAGEGLEATDDPAAELLEDWRPTSPFMKRRYAEKRGARLEQDMADNERAHSIIPDTLADIRRRQAQNSEDVVAIAQSVSEVEAAESACDGPGLSLMGKLRVMADRQVGSPTLPEFYLKDYAVCRSKAAQLALEHAPVPERMYVPSGALPSVPNFTGFKYPFSA